MIGVIEYMKDLFDKLGESIKTTYKEAVDQTQKTVGQTKYKVEALNLKNELKKLYQRLGEDYYKSYTKEDTEPCNLVLCNRITVLLKDIEKLESKIEGVAHTQKDSFEAYKREVKTMWDDHIADDQTIQKDENGIKILKFCQHCNIGNSQSAVYCMNCGHKF